MTRPRLILAFTATALISAAATFLTREVLSDEAPVPGTQAVQLRSTVLDEDREYFVHLPEGYTADTAKRYPVLYVLDGTSQSGHTAESAALLARIGVIPPIIVVGVPSPDGEIRNRDYTPPEMRLDTDKPGGPMGAADHFLSFLQTELLPRVEQEYRTTRPRMLTGWSRGGLFVVYSQVLAPSLFDGRFAHSPALWREDDGILTSLEQALGEEPPPGGFLFLSLGDRENEKMTGAFRKAVQLLESRAPATLRWSSYLSVRGVHESNPRLSTPIGLCAMFMTCAEPALPPRPASRTAPLR